MFERMTDRARRVLVLAQEEARLLDHNWIGTEHLLLGMIHENEGVAAAALQHLAVDLEAVRLLVEDEIKELHPVDVDAETLPPPTRLQASLVAPPFTPRAKKVIELSLREALQLGHNYIGTEHMLLGLVREGEGVAAKVLVGLGVTLSQIRQEVIQILSGYRPQAKEAIQILEDAPDNETLLYIISVKGHGSKGMRVTDDWDDAADLIKIKVDDGDVVTVRPARVSFESDPAGGSRAGARGPLPR